MKMTTMIVRTMKYCPTLQLQAQNPPRSQRQVMSETVNLQETAKIAKLTINQALHLEVPPHSTTPLTGLTVTSSAQASKATAVVNASNTRAITRTEIVAKVVVVAVATTTMTAEITTEMIVVMVITMAAPSPIIRAVAALAVTEATEMVAKAVDTAITEAITTIDGTISGSRVAPMKSLTRRQLTPIPTIDFIIRMIPTSSVRQ